MIKVIPVPVEMLGRLIGNGLVLPASHTSIITGHVVESVSDDIMPKYSLFPTSSHQKVRGRP